jgi:DNA primase
VRDKEKPCAYRPQRQWAVRDAEEAMRRLPEGPAREYYRRFLREYYAVDAKAVREGLHADRLKPEHVARLPARVRMWWGRQLEIWPAKAALWAAARLGLKPGELDSTLRRSLYVEQNAATRDVYSLGRVQPLEEGDQI